MSEIRMKSRMSYFTKETQNMCLSRACLGRQQLQQVDCWPEQIKIETTNQTVCLGLLGSSFQTSANIGESHRQYVNFWKSKLVSFASIYNVYQSAMAFGWWSDAMCRYRWIFERFHFLSKTRAKAHPNACIEMCLVVTIYKRNLAKTRQSSLKL